MTADMFGQLTATRPGLGSGGGHRLRVADVPEQQEHGGQEQYQGDVLVPASATLVDTLREHDLVDEYHLMVHPVVLGSGKRLFKEGAAGTDLRLTDCRMAGPDVLLLILQPADRPGDGGNPAS
jgi:dihydrofolate reductase